MKPFFAVWRRTLGLLLWIAPVGGIAVIVGGVLALQQCCKGP